MIKSEISSSLLAAVVEANGLFKRSLKMVLGVAVQFKDESRYLSVYVQALSKIPDFIDDIGNIDNLLTELAVVACSVYDEVWEILVQRLKIITSADCNTLAVPATGRNMIMKYRADAECMRQDHMAYINSMTTVINHALGMLSSADQTYTPIS